MRAFVLVFALYGALCAPAQTAAPSRLPFGVETGGLPLRRLAPPNARAVVLFFVATDCPVSNRTFPEMKRLREKFAAQGVQTWFVYPNAGEEPAAVQAHQKEFDPEGVALLDREGALVRQAGAVATPEIAVLRSDGRGGWTPAYVGRIDNRYVRLGLERPAATEHFGEDAIQAVIEERAPKAPAGQPVGCAIVNRSAR